MIPALDPDPESEFQLFGNSNYGFESNRNGHHNTYTGIMLGIIRSDQESDFQPFGYSLSRFRSSKKRNRNTSSITGGFPLSPLFTAIICRQVLIRGH